MDILPRKEFERQLTTRWVAAGLSPEDAALEAAYTKGVCLDPEREVLLPRGATSNVKLHEVGHKILGLSDRYSDVETEAHTIGDDILDEILAERFTYETKGKKLTYRLAIPAVTLLVGKPYAFSPESAVHWSLYVLKKELGITVTRQQRRELARHARGIVERPRKE